MALSDGRARMKIFFRKLIKFTGVLYKQNKSNATILRLLINTMPAYMPIDEMPIVIRFISSLRMA